MTMTAAAASNHRPQKAASLVLRITATEARNKPIGTDSVNAIPHSGSADSWPAIWLSSAGIAPPAAAKAA
jgi:hypothetical protein